jgi:hypothetical protein
MLKFFIIIPPISIYLCKRLDAEKKEEKEKQKKDWTLVPMRNIYMQPKFSFILQSLKREKLFPSMEHCRIRLSPLSFYLIYSPSF